MRAVTMYRSCWNIKRAHPPAETHALSQKEVPDFCGKRCPKQREKYECRPYEESDLRAKATICGGHHRRYHQSLRNG